MGRPPGRPRKANPKKIASYRLPPDLIDEVRAASRRKGAPSQAVIVETALRAFLPTLEGKAEPLAVSPDGKHVTKAEDVVTVPQAQPVEIVHEPVGKPGKSPDQLRYEARVKELIGRGLPKPAATKVAYQEVFAPKAAGL